MTLTQVSTAGVKDDAVTSGKIPANAVGSSELADNAVDTAAIAADAVTTAKIAAGNVTATELGTNAVTSAKLAAGAVSEAGKIADSIITGAKIGSGTIAAGNLATNSITTAKITDGNVTTSKLADQSVTLAKLPHGTSSNNGKFLRANNGADPSFETVTSTTINNNADNRVITGSGTANTLEGESALTFDGSQNLKIGSTSYTAHSAADNLVVGNGGSDGITILTSDTGTANLFLDSVNGDRAKLQYAHNEDKMHIGTTGGTALTIDSSGNVGIGTTSPQSAGLTVENSSEARFRLRAGSNASNGEVALRADGGNTQLGTWSNHDLKIVRNSTIKASITSNGLCFNSDTAAANALDDYEEGTWSPGINSGTANFGNAYYTKVGRFVNATVFVSGMSPRTANSGIQITNLPFQANGIFVAPLGLHRVIGDQGNGYFAYVSDNTTTIDLLQYPWSQQGWKSLNHNQIQHATAAYIIITVSYQTD